jgi:hypothetical protein
MMLAIIRYVTGNLLGCHAPEASDAPPARGRGAAGAGPNRRASNISAVTTTASAAGQGAADKEEAAQAAVFAGREAELSKLTELLQSSDFVAVQGEPGAGKSSLALVGAMRLQANLGSPAYYADLSGCTSEDEICRSIASAVGVDADETGYARLELWVEEAAKGMSALLVLDNCEDPAATEKSLKVFAQVLRGLVLAKGIRILLTSREKIRLINVWKKSADYHAEAGPVAMGTSEV